MNTGIEAMGDSVPRDNPQAQDILGQWQRFVRGQPPDSPLHPVIHESWLRCRGAGVDPDPGQVPRRVAEEDLRRRLQAHAELLAVARPHLSWVSSALSLVPHVVYLTDGDGVVLDAVGTRPRLEELGVVPGYDRSEQAMGTNGAGTALAANQAVAVIGPEHYCSPFHDCTCLGVPLHAPDGSVVGAVVVNTGVADGSPERLVLAAHIGFVIDREIADREGARRAERERAEAAAALTENQARLQLMADALPVLISYVDADHRYRFNNAAYERWFGIPRHAVRGRHLREVLGEDAYRALEARVAAALAGQPQSFEQRVPYRGAGLRDVQVDYVPHRLADGRVAGFYALIADVTERRRAEEAVRQSEELTRAILNALTAHIAVLDRGGNIIAVNSAWQRFARANGDPAMTRSGDGVNYLDVCRRAGHDDPDLSMQVLAGLERVLDGSLREFSIEYPCHSPSEKRWFLLHATPLSPSLGGAVVSHTSVTELKRVEEALRDSERRWRDMAEALPQLVWTCAPDGGCDFLSRQWVAYTGRPEAEQLGYGWLEQVHPDDRSRLMAMWGEAVASGTLFDVEFRIRRADGAYRWFKTRAAPVLGADGRVAKWFGSNTDIEDLKRATEALHESEERFRTFMDNTSASAWMKDGQGRYVYLNKPFEKHFGVCLEDWRGKTDFEVWPREVAEQFRRNDQEVLRSGQPREVVEQTLSADGRLRTWLTSKFPFRDGSGRSYVGGIGFDITERMELEREVLEIATLEQRRIGQELHDSVGQELTGLGLLADALARELPAGSAEAALAEKIVRGLGRTRRQVRSLSHGLVPVEVDPEGLRAALEQLAVSTEESSGCACTFESAGPLTVPDPGLATHLFRIAQEAVSNSLRHSQARHVRIALDAEPEALTLSVQDDGVGIAEPTHGVKGLGLRLMRYRASVIGGYLTVGPAAGGGTRVACRIPLGTTHEHHPREQGPGDPDSDCR